MRGIAALAVAVHHLSRLYLSDGPTIAPSLAVDLFFILSGFVMARTYEARMRDGLTVTQFLAIRYRRLFLPFAIGSTLGLMWAVLKLGPAPDLFAAYALILAFMPAWWMANSFVLNGPAWSLFLEISANALHASALWRLSREGILILWLAMVPLFCIFFFAGAHWRPGIGFILLLIPRVLCCYLMGILIFRRYGDTPLGNKPMWAIAVFPVLLIATSIGPITEVLVTLIAAPLVIRASLGLENARWALWAGALSYPLYATHVPVIRLSVLAGVNPVTALALSLLTAVAVTLLFEARRGPSLKPALA